MITADVRSVERGPSRSGRIRLGDETQRCRAWRGRSHASSSTLRGSHDEAQQRRGGERAS
jgi:hypothetical protein